MTKQRILTGITTSGTPHLGNYAGAIRPAVAASRREDVESFYFLADYHALVKVQDPLRVQRSTLEIAASWLAAGLDPDRVWFYRQSDIPEIPELAWLLTCIAGKGLLNRAHAYKAAVDRNVSDNLDPDAGVSAGLFMYPVLMAADILMFGANKVPVGRDQMQHIEMARDFAARFNHLYGEHFVLPEAVIDDQVATLPGLDGRKMSKSYDNTIPLFATSGELRKLIFGIVTDSREPGQAKDTEGSALFQLYQAFANAEQSTAMRAAFAGGIAWGDAKLALFELIDAQVAPMRQRYHELIARPAEIEQVLVEGARRARLIAVPLMADLRRAVGLRGLGESASKGGRVSEAGRAGATRSAQPSFKQYRERDGKFYFKLLDADGRLLVQSVGHDSAQLAGQRVASLKAGGAGLRQSPPSTLRLGEDALGELGESVGLADVTSALAAFAASEA